MRGTYCIYCAMPDGHRLKIIFNVLEAVHGSLGLPGRRLSRGFTLLSPFSHSSPSLIGILASVDFKQHYSQSVHAIEGVDSAKLQRASVADHRGKDRRTHASETAKIIICLHYKNVSFSGLKAGVSRFGPAVRH